MEGDLDQLRERAERVRWWATSIADPRDRERLEVVARDYEKMARVAENATATHTADSQTAKPAF
jgi:hypothetical protein